MNDLRPVRMESDAVKLLRARADAEHRAFLKRARAYKPPPLPSERPLVEG